MKCYLAGPIDFDSGIVGDWKVRVKEWFKEQNDMVIFDPDTYTFNSPTPSVSKYIHDVNMAAIDHSDLIIARWMQGQISVGTPMELYYATERGKRILLCTDMDIKSVYINYIVWNGNCTRVHNLGAMYEMILKIKEDIDSGFEKQREMLGKLTDKLTKTLDENEVCKGMD